MRHHDAGRSRAAAESSTADERAESAQNVRLVGYNDLQGRESLRRDDAVRPGERKLGVRGPSRELLGQKPKMNPITGQEEWNGTSILNVDDPANPTYVWHIPRTPDRNSRGVSVVYDYKFDGSAVTI